jgi:hypothetical protein
MCIKLHPQTFHVFVDVSQQSISVTPSQDSTPAIDIEPSDTLKDNAIWSLNLLSRMTPSLYESVLGNTLQKNVQMLLVRPGNNMTAEETTLTAIAGSFTAMLDDILVGFGSTQLALMNPSTTVPVTGALHAVQTWSEQIYICHGGYQFVLTFVARC